MSEENKFKVGDKVKLLSTSKTNESFGYNRDEMMKVSDEGVVEEIIDEFDVVVYYNDECYSYHVDDLELIECEDQTNEQEVKCDSDKQMYNPLVAQEGGGHYKDKGIQPLEYTMQNNLSFCEGNVVKYISRYKSKNGIEDLAKVIHYTLLASYEEYGEKGSTELRNKVLKLLGVSE